MGRPDKHARQQKRAREAVQAALMRGNDTLTAEAVLELPVAERAEVLSELAPRIVRHFERLRQARQLAEAAKWLPRLASEPRLLPPGSEGDAGRWVLLVAALTTGQWQHARVLFAGLRTALAAPLATQLAAFLDAEGRLESEHLPLFAEDEAEALRLGHPATPSASVGACPAAVPAVEDACVALFATVPFSRSRDGVRSWLTVASPEVGAEIRRVAVTLCEGPLLEATELASPRSLEAARFAAQLALEAQCPASFEAIVGRALRSLATSLTGTVQEVRLVQQAEAILAASLHYPSLTSRAQEVALAPLYHAEACEAALRLFRALLGVCAAPRLLLRTARVGALHASHNHKERFIAPEWLVRATQTLLTQPADSASELAAELESGHGATLDLIGALPGELALSVIELALGAAGDLARARLAPITWDVITDLRCAAVSTTLSARDLERVREMMLEDLEEVLHLDPLALGMPGLSDRELRRLLSTPEGQGLRLALAEERALEQPLPAAVRASFERIADAVVPYSLELLELALEPPTTKEERERRLHAFLLRRDTLASRLEALREAVETGLPRCSSALEEALCWNITPDALDAARAFTRAERGAPIKLRREIARLLCEAVERDPAQEIEPVVTQALRRARRLLTKKTAKPKAEKPKAKSSTTKPKATAAKTAKGSQAHEGAAKKKPKQATFSFAEEPAP